MMNILYVHGLGGHENGNASNLVKEELNKRSLDFNLKAPQFPVTNPELMRTLLYENIRGKDFAVASSLGAFYAMQVDGVNKILINPALPENLEKLNDKQVTPELLNELYNEKEAFLNKVRNKELKDEIYIIFGNHDTVAPNSEYFRTILNQCSAVHFINIDMEHKMEASGAVAICNILVNYKSKIEK